jgi:putative addiction module antidote
MKIAFNSSFIPNYIFYGSDVIIFVKTNRRAMGTLKIRKVGNFLGITFPEEIVSKLNLTEGDTLFIAETPDGISLTLYNPDFDQAMQAFESTRKKYRSALQQLAE